MLADTVEALSRSIREVNMSKVKNAIHSVIKEKFEEGQLDECPLTIRELRKIGGAFEKILVGVYHERIEYPGQEKMLSGKKSTNPAVKLEKSKENLPGKKGAKTESQSIQK